MKKLRDIAESREKARRGLAAALLLAVMVAVTGCVGGRTIGVDAGYSPAEEPESPFDQTLSIAVVPFKSGEGVTSEIGAWRGILGGEDTITSTRPVEEVVTGAVRDYLEAAGFTVEEAHEGAELADYTTAPPDLAMTGRVEGLTVNARSQLGSTRVESEVRMRVKVKNLVDGSVITIAVEGSSQPVTVVAFNRDVFEETLEAVLSDAVERIFSNTSLRKGTVRPAVD